MGYEQILTAQHEAVLVITLNRPERLNAWTPKMSRELISAITAADADPSIGAIVVTGCGSWLLRRGRYRWRVRLQT
jgi:2-(1,2-epoxy-1,2-dihydrophenyl)acetyl-CoA isomerase